ncbi:MAG TPA: cyclase family protein [Blastocatellia bacterium]|nr:cyclase family protein [Blastocatellia bacterium]
MIHKTLSTAAMLIGLIAVLTITGMVIAETAGRAAQAQHRLTKADVDRMMTEISNWGRWGKEDQLGAVNLITPMKRKQAAALVKEGVSVSLARETNSEKEPDNPNPYQHTMNLTGSNNPGQFSVDTLSVLFHGYQHTHMDALCHIFYRGKMYNGFSQEEVTRKGAGKLAISNLRQGILTRGVLMDMAALKGVPYLEPGTPIYPEDLEAWEKKAGIKVQSGDAVFIRTGRWARRAAVGPWDVDKTGAAGLHASCARWLRARDVAVLGSDAASDVLPSGIEGFSHPIHTLTLVALGVYIFDNCDLEALGEAAAKRKRWDFLLTAAPIPVSGGTGSPLNPVATF